MHCCGCYIWPFRRTALILMRGISGDIAGPWGLQDLHWHPWAPRTESDMPSTRRGHKTGRRHPHPCLPSAYLFGHHRTSMCPIRLWKGTMDTCQNMYGSILSNFVGVPGVDICKQECRRDRLARSTNVDKPSVLSISEVQTKPLNFSDDWLGAPSPGPDSGGVWAPLLFLALWLCFVCWGAPSLSCTKRFGQRVCSTYPPHQPTTNQHCSPSTTSKHRLQHANKDINERMR